MRCKNCRFWDKNNDDPDTYCNTPADYGCEEGEPNER